MPYFKLPKWMTVEMPDGSVYGVPVMMIARNRAKHYASEFGGSIERSLAEDTLPYFAGHHWNIEDWACNQMDWSDFDGYQVKLKEANQPDFIESWMSGDKGTSLMQTVCCCGSVEGEVHGSLCLEIKTRQQLDDQGEDERWK